VTTTTLSTTTVPPPASTTTQPPVLGSAAAFPSPDARGFGQVAPPAIFFGGEAESAVTKIVWTSWGASQTTGTGTGFDNVGGASAADGHFAPETLVAFDLGICKGSYMYERLTTFFPEEGQTFSSTPSIDVCNGFGGPG
jgi:hypothetical protein